MPIGFRDVSLLQSHVFIRKKLPKSANWHFYSALTFDKKFRDALVYLWTAFRQRKSDFNCLRQWWDHGETEIKLLCQQHTFSLQIHKRSGD